MTDSVCVAGGVMMQACSPRAGEAEAGIESLRPVWVTSFFFFFSILRKTGSHIAQADYKLAYSQGWLWISDPSVLISQVRELQSNCSLADTIPDVKDLSTHGIRQLQDS